MLFVSYTARHYNDYKLALNPSFFYPGPLTYGGPFWPFYSLTNLAKTNSIRFFKDSQQGAQHGTARSATGFSHAWLAPQSPHSRWSPRLHLGTVPRISATPPVHPLRTPHTPNQKSHSDPPTLFPPPSHHNRQNASHHISPPAHTPSLIWRDGSILGVKTV